MIDSCGTCRFAGERFNFENHECKRHAPAVKIVPFHEDLRGHVPMFPIMRAGDWCGEYELRAPKASREGA